MTAKELKTYIQKQRGEQASPGTELPADLTEEKFRQMDLEEVQKLVKR